MTDRELLELAAKASGMQITDWPQPDYAIVLDREGNSFGWSPLRFDSDALRLAVKLKLSVWFEEREHHEWTHIIWVSPVFEPYTGDVNAATRRAIVRAAAEIGRTGVQR